MRAAVHVFQVYCVAGDGHFWWRLMSANGRALARSPEPTGSAREAHAGITLLVASIDHVVARLSPTQEGRWRWSLDLDGVTVVVGVGDHDRRVRSDHAWKRFVLSAPLAVVSPTLHSFHRVGRPSTVAMPTAVQVRSDRPGPGELGPRTLLAMTAAQATANAVRSAAARQSSVVVGPSMQMTGQGGTA